MKTRHPYRRFLSATVAMLTLLVAGSLVAAPSASAATRLGGISVEKECQAQSGYHARIATWSSFGWKCNPYPNPVPPQYFYYDQDVNMNRACVRQYPQYSGVYANYADAGNPYSWSCYR